MNNKKLYNVFFPTINYGTNKLFTYCGCIELTKEEVKMVQTGTLSIVNDNNKLQLIFDNGNIEDINTIDIPLLREVL